MLTSEDINIIVSRGQTIEQVEKQIEMFKKGFPFMRLVRAATPQDGIRVFDENTINSLVLLFENEMPALAVKKFVPASGAATRMFKNLFEFLAYYDKSTDAIERYKSDTGFNSIQSFIDNIKKFAFYDDLKNALTNQGIHIESAIENKDYHLIISCLLDDKGLGYGKLPKGLLAFHKYGNSFRTAFEEHLVEGVNYAKNGRGEVKLHFTVSPEHRKGFTALLDKVRPHYEKEFEVSLQIGFSEQKPSTDTIAVDLDNKVFRDVDGSPLFRPAGHGALIENLNEMGEEIIFIKNIDNIVPDRLKPVTYRYKKALGGLLLQIRSRVHEALHLLDIKELSQDEVLILSNLVFDELQIDKPAEFDNPDFNKAEFFFSRLNRPIRVCGMVKNEGEPGGGPFWVRNANSEISLQIVESSQVNLNDSIQKTIMSNATHFNPVDLVCCIRDYKGNPFDLKYFVDSSAGFISEKSKDGKQLKAMELPGLWNGAMADWITIFMEVPVESFNPVKTVNDLLRPQHQ